MMLLIQRNIHKLLFFFLTVKEIAQGQNKENNNEKKPCILFVMLDYGMISKVG